MNLKESNQYHYNWNPGPEGSRFFRGGRLLITNATDQRITIYYEEETERR